MIGFEFEWISSFFFLQKGNRGREIPTDVFGSNRKLQDLSTTQSCVRYVDKVVTTGQNQVGLYMNFWDCVMLKVRDSDFIPNLFEFRGFLKRQKKQKKANGRGGGRRWPDVL